MSSVETTDTERHGKATSHGKATERAPVVERNDFSPPSVVSGWATITTDKTRINPMVALRDIKDRIVGHILN